jgi:hypothetical protein
MKAKLLTAFAAALVSLSLAAPAPAYADNSCDFTPTNPNNNIDACRACMKAHWNDPNMEVECGVPGATPVQAPPGQVPAPPP